LSNSQLMQQQQLAYLQYLNSSLVNNRN
jgi:hypothetical protein